MTLEPDRENTLRAKPSFVDGKIDEYRKFKNTHVLQVLQAFAAYRSVGIVEPRTLNNVKPWTGNAGIQSKREERALEQLVADEFLEVVERYQEGSAWQLTPDGEALIDRWYERQNSTDEALFFGNAGLPKFTPGETRPIVERENHYYAAHIMQHPVLNGLIWELMKEEYREEYYIFNLEEAVRELKAATELQIFKLVSVLPDETGCIIVERGREVASVLVDRFGSEALRRYKYTTFFDEDKFDQFCDETEMDNDARESLRNLLSNRSHRESAWLIGVAGESGIGREEFDTLRFELFRIKRNAGLQAIRKLTIYEKRRSGQLCGNETLLEMVSRRIISSPDLEGVIGGRLPSSAQPEAPVPEVPSGESLLQKVFSLFRRGDRRTSGMDQD